MLEIGFSSALFLTATGAIFILSMLVNAPIEVSIVSGSATLLCLLGLIAKSKR